MAEQHVLDIIIRAKDEATKTIDDFGKKTDKLLSKINPLAVGMTAVGAGTLFVAKSSADAAIEMEKQQKAFGVLLGSVDKANTLLAELQQFAISTPFELPQIIDGSKQLLAYGFAQEDVVKNMKMLGNVAAGLNIPLGDLIYLHGTLRAQNRAYTKDLNQLTSRGIPILDQLAKQFKINKEEVFQWAEDGKISFKDVETALTALQSEGGPFFNQMGAQMETTSGKMSNLADEVFKLKVQLGNALLPIIKQVIETLIPIISQVSEFAQKNPELTKTLVAVGLAVGAIGTAILILTPIVTGLIATISFFTTVVGGAIAMIGSIIAVLGGPLTLAIIAIGAIVTALAFAWKNNWGGIQEKTRAVIDWIVNTAVPWIKNNFFGVILSALDFFTNGWASRFKLIIDVVERLGGSLQGLIDKARELSGKTIGGIKLPSFQHGGIVPGGINDAVPAILHGSERVVSRTGADVNASSVPSININISGAFHMDSESRVDQLAQRIISILSRQNEIAGKGLAV